jgi:primosomal protein N'
MSRSKPKQPAVHDPKDNLKIFLRVKPILAAPPPQSLKVISHTEVEVTAPYSSPEGERVFSYEEVFPPASTNQLIFSKTMQEPIANVLAGHNSTVFIYGMTGAGKTHTMFHAIAGEEGEDEGLVGLALRKLCREVEAESACQLLISFCEVYNEHIRDLLAEGSHSLALLEDPLRGVVVDQLTELPLSTESQGRSAIR